MGKELLTEKEIKDIEGQRKFATKGMVIFWSVLLVISLSFAFISSYRSFGIILVFASCTAWVVNIINTRRWIKIVDKLMK